jgi:hypothetical protein
LRRNLGDERKLQSSLLTKVKPKKPDLVGIVEAEAYRGAPI